MAARAGVRPVCDRIQESAVVGETPNLAARLQALAKPDTVVISPATYELAGGHFEYEDLGQHKLKGIVEPVKAWRVVGLSVVESRFEASHKTALTPLVGREHEIALLLDRWEQAKEGDGQVVLLSGEAGIGKSRITQTLRERSAIDEPIRLRYQCSPYHTNSALYPIIEHLERAARFEEGDSPATKLDKLESLLGGPKQEALNITVLVAALLAIPSQGRYAPLEMPPDRQKERFKHALVQDAAYDGLLRSRRQQLHARIGEALEQRFPERVESEPEMLAHHYTEAGLGEPAVEYWLRAGRQAMERSADREAVAHLTKGLEILEALPESTERDRKELGLQMALSRSLGTIQGWASGKSMEGYARARELCERVGDSEQLITVLIGYRVKHWRDANYRAAVDVTHQIARLAEQQEAHSRSRSHTCLQPGHILVWANSSRSNPPSTLFCALRPAQA